MDKAKKKRIKRYATWAAMVTVVALLTALPLLAKSTPEVDGPRASVLSATVESGNIRQVINGGGTLSADTVDVKIPDGVRITEFLVKNGDHVTAGTPVAAVDKVSVLAAMSQVEDTLDYLREEMEDAKDETVSGTIYATTGGRVKKVYAAPGESVQQVMLRDGCLALLSVDGKMAVAFAVKSDVITGQSMSVSLADGTSVTGRVESNLNGEVIVTVEDKGYAIGTAVTVEGLGQGSLYVHNAWKATGISGTIATVRAKEESVFSAGTALFILEDTDYDGQWEHRISQHKDYEDLLQRLTHMYKSGTIDAPCDGVITGVDENSAYLLAAEAANWEVQLLNQTADNGYRVMLLSSSEDICTHATQVDECKASSHESDCIESCDPANCSATGAHKSNCITFCTRAKRTETCTAGHHYTNCIGSCENATVEDDCDGSDDGNYHYTTCIESCDPAQGEKCPAGRIHKKTCLLRCSKASVESGCDATGKHYPMCIHSCTGTEECTAGHHKKGCPAEGFTYYAKVAKVEQVGNTEYIVSWDMSDTDYLVTRVGDTWSFVTETYDPAQLLNNNGPTVPKSSDSRIVKGSIILYVTRYDSSGKSEELGAQFYQSGSSGNQNQPGNPGSGFPGGGMGGGMSGGFGGGGYSVTSEEDEGLYDLDGDTLLSVITQETMTVSISLDEQDISKVSIGMEAAVEVVALRGRTYTAVISGIGFSGENDGGSSKFPVELTLDVDQDMLDGMSTTAQIVLETRENIPVIPVAALNGDSVNAYVYTALDKNTGEPTNPVDVQIGMSDGENAEILSGLTIGDTVYYHYYDVLELDTSA